MWLIFLNEEIASVLVFENKVLLFYSGVLDIF